MNLKKSKYCISVLIIILTFSCEKDVSNVRLPEFKQKLVVSSFISPGNADSYSYINVTSNRRIYGESGKTELTGNITGYLSDDIREVPLETTATGFILRQRDMNIEEGKTYHLKILSDKGLKAEATCTVPFRRSFELEADTTREVYYYPNDVYYSSIKLNIYYRDFPGEDNYYRLFCKQETYSKNNKVPNFTRIFSGFENEFFNDKGIRNEKSLIASFGLYDEKYIDSSFFRIYIFNTDKGYYDYHLSLKNYSGGEDPFTEVSPIFSNISGGLGIFAAYTVDSLIFRLK